MIRGGNISFTQTDDASKKTVALSERKPLDFDLKLVN